MKELHEMSFSDLLALIKFIDEEIDYHQKFGNKVLAKWKHNRSVVQQHINKKTAEYFDETPITQYCTNHGY